MSCQWTAYRSKIEKEKTAHTLRILGCAHRVHLRTKPPHCWKVQINECPAFDQWNREGILSPYPTGAVPGQSCCMELGFLISSQIFKVKAILCTVLNIRGIRIGIHRKRNTQVQFHVSVKFLHVCEAFSVQFLFQRKKVLRWTDESVNPDCMEESPYILGQGQCVGYREWINKICSHIHTNDLVSDWLRAVLFTGDFRKRHVVKAGTCVNKNCEALQLAPGDNS